MFVQKSGKIFRHTYIDREACIALNDQPLNQTGWFGDKRITWDWKGLTEKKLRVELGPKRGPCKCIWINADGHFGLGFAVQKKLHNAAWGSRWGARDRLSAAARARTHVDDWPHEDSTAVARGSTSTLGMWTGTGLLECGPRGARAAASWGREDYETRSRRLMYIFEIKGFWGWKDLEH